MQCDAVPDCAAVSGVRPNATVTPLPSRTRRVAVAATTLFTNGSDPTSGTQNGVVSQTLQPRSPGTRVGASGKQCVHPHKMHTLSPYPVGPTRPLQFTHPDTELL